MWVESSNYSIRFVLYASMAHRTCDISCWKEGRGEEPDETMTLKRRACPSHLWLNYLCS